jgi:hypothetical protein
MTPEDIRLPSVDGITFDATEYIPVDIVEETSQIDSLNGDRFEKNPEPMSNMLSQEELLILCEAVRTQIFSPENRETIAELLSLHGFACPEPLTNTSRILPGNDIADEIDYPAHYQYLHMDNPIEIPRVDHPVKSRRQSAKHPSKLR